MPNFEGQNFPDFCLIWLFIFSDFAFEKECLDLAHCTYSAKCYVDNVNQTINAFVHA